MIDLLNRLSKRYYLQLGDYSFSPVLKLTAGISLEYSDMLKANKILKEPFIFCFPETKAAALWTSIALLTNYFFEDYVNNGVKENTLNAGDKILIFGCVAQIARIQNGTIVLQFRDQGGLQLNDKLKAQISYVSQKRTLNLLNKYKEARKEAKKNRNPISKILYPDDEVFINQRNLNSQILLVAGRGQVKKFHDFLKTIEIYGEKLNKVFPEGENLIITPDLENFKFSGNCNDEKNENEFMEILKKASENDKFEEVRDVINTLIRIYKINDQISEEFDEIFRDMIDDFKGDVPPLDFLEKKYPRLSKSSTENIRAVIINDTSQLVDYSDTVKSFLERGIPVIIFSDRQVLNLQDSSFFKNLFNERPNTYRLNWNKSKFRSLKHFLEKEEIRREEIHENEDGTFFYVDPVTRNKIPWTEDYFIDQALWNQALRYESQIIRINTFQGSSLDILAPNLLKHIKSLDEFGVLQKSFYENLHPAIYALKNSRKTNESVLRLIGSFKYDLTLIQNHLPKDVASDFIETIEIAEKFEENTKVLSFTKDTFSVNVPMEFDKNFTIPINSRKENIPNQNTNRIVFTGYPFNEYSGKYLSNSVFNYLVPEIELKCWPNEASLTHNYLKRRIEGGYFLDRLPEGIDFDQSLRIKSDSDIQSEIDSYLLIGNISNDDIQTEEDLEFIHQFKYKAYLSNTDCPANWKVISNVLNFDDGSFMFLAEGSKILCLSEDDNGKLKVFDKSADKFLSGDVIFRYIKDRAAYAEISMREKQVSESYKQLEYWRDVLQKLYSKNRSNIKTLENFLQKIKKDLDLEGNPTRNNIERWLFDDELISPKIDNLRLILKAAVVEDIEARLLILQNAYKIADAYRKTLSKRIKLKISKKISTNFNLSGDFQITIDGESINVETRTISTIDTNGIEVDYHNTRKILC